ncbi:MAG: tetratricopeptide repeat protein [Armatimonadota bacterium]|nr:tetratricopeptide repeat protein [Armatimonadota bacterium]
MLARVRAEALLAIGEARRQLTQFDDALPMFARVLAEHPQCRSTCAEATLNTAKTYQAKGDSVTAIDWYARVLRNYSDKITRADFARIRIGSLLDKGAVLSDEAKASLNAAIAIYDAAKTEDEEITAVRRQAKTKAETGAVSEATSDLLALYSRPAVQGSHSRLSSLASAQFAVGDKTNARTTLNKLLVAAAHQMGPEEYRGLRVQTFYDLEDFAAAIAEGKEAAEIYGDTLSMCVPQYYVARAYEQLRRIDECLVAYDHIISHYCFEKDSVDARAVVSMSLGRSANRLEKLGRTTEAIAKCQQLVADYAETPMATSAAKSLRRLQGPPSPGQEGGQ